MAPASDALVLLTNGRGGMARMCVDLGRVRSKYDCVLAANLHPSLPVDRHVFAKRMRVWVNADGFLTPLDGRSITTFTPGPRQPTSACALPARPVRATRPATRNRTCGCPG